MLGYHVNELWREQLLKLRVEVAGYLCQDGPINKLDVDIKTETTKQEYSKRPQRNWNRKVSYGPFSRYSAIIRSIKES